MLFRSWNSCSTRQINADRLEQFVIENLKRIALDTHYIESSIFKRNFEEARRQEGLELRETCLPIDAKSVQNSLKNFVESIDKASKIEQGLVMQKFIQSIIYSKNSIQINLFCSLQPIQSQNLKNPAPVLNLQACGWVGVAASRRKISLPEEKDVILKDNVLSSLAPPRGLEPRTWWLHLTRNYFRKWTISLPYSD